MAWMAFKPLKTVTVITYNYSYHLQSRITTSIHCWDRPIRWQSAVVTRHKDNAIAQWYEADVTEGLTLTADMPSDDGTESVCSCSHRCCGRQLILIFSKSFSTLFPACCLVCLPGVIMPSVLSTFWVLSVRHLMALLCIVGLCVHLWRVDCVTRHECDEWTGDELTVWRDDRVTTWLTSWLVAVAVMNALCILWSQKNEQLQQV